MIEFDGASKRFGALAALDGCTFAARPDRLTGFLGPNGAGKTTAMRAVFGLVELNAGTVRWKGAPIAAAERGRFGYMPEERGLYPRMRVRDQLVYLGQLCGGTGIDVGRSVDTWLERLGLADRARDRLDALSHGNQQHTGTGFHRDTDRQSSHWHAAPKTGTSDLDPPPPTGSSVVTREDRTVVPGGGDVRPYRRGRPGADHYINGMRRC